MKTIIYCTIAFCTLVMLANFVNANEPGISLTIVKNLTQQTPGILSVSNTGDFPLTNVQMSSTANFGMIFLPNNFNLSPNQSKNVNFSLSDVLTLPFGYNHLSVSAASAEGIYDDVSMEVTRSFCKFGPVGNGLDWEAEISNQDGDDNYWRPGDVIQIEVQYVNHAQSPLNDILLEIGLFDSDGIDISNGLEFLNNEGNVISLGDLPTNERDFATFSFKVPKDLTPGTYKLAFKLFSGSNGLGEENLCTDRSDLDHIFFEEVEVINENAFVNQKLYDCQYLMQSGVYTVQHNLSSSDTCFVIIANNVTLDLNGYTLFGTEEGIAVDVRGADFSSIKNGVIDGFSLGISLKSHSNNNLVSNLRIIHSGYGITANENTNNSIVNSTITLSNLGFFSSSISNYSLINNSFSKNHHGVDCSYCTYSLWNNNTINSNDLGFFLTLDSHHNLLEKNIISENGDGIVFTSGPTNNMIKGNLIEDNNGGVDNVGIGLYHGSDDNMILDNFIKNHEFGAWIYYNSKNNTLSNNSFTSNTIPILVRETQGTVISHNWVYNNSYSYGVGYQADYTQIYDNYFSNSRDSYYGSYQVHNVWNIDKRAGKNILGGMRAGGNYWSRPDGKGFSDLCIDSNKDGFCDQSFLIESPDTDYLPLSRFQVRKFAPIKD